MGNRERLLETAADLFGRGGYRATSMDQILRAAGVGPSNFYYHFASKEALAYEVLEKFFECARKEIAPLLMNRRLGARVKLERLFGFFTDRMAKAGCCVGCPMGNLAQELSDVHPGFRRRIAEFFEEWVEGVTGVIREGARRGEFRRDFDPVGAAYLVVGLIQGLMLLSKNVKKVEPARKGFRQALALLTARK